MQETATIAGGCFWCTEAIFKRLNGVLSVTPGYTGGKRENPSYEQVVTDVTGHAEAVQIIFDPQIISYETLLEIFWHTHNPTMPNQQDYDIGSQYRSAIFYHSNRQKDIAETSKMRLEDEHIYQEPIVTEIVPFTAFYKAEDYHKEYYENNQNAPYCQVIINPKIKKLLELYRNEVKEEYR